MGEVIALADVRRARTSRPARAARVARPGVELFFDLASPMTYLLAERVERGMTGVAWRPAVADVLGAPSEDRVATASRAAELRMPLVWPEARPGYGRIAMRVAHFAADRGQAAPFVLAASRLAFCGGFDLDDPEILAEAAAAASLPLDACLQAAGDRARDRAMEDTALGLLALGATELPVLRVGVRLFCGETRFAEAAAAVRSDALGKPRLGLDSTA